MLSSHSLPETQAALALSIFFATFIYEDGATYWRRLCRPAEAWTRGSDF